MERHDVVVIGAGAAGMMCAARAGQRGRRVLLVDHYPKLGEKIRISGGGRCNFTNTGAAPDRYLSQDPGFCATALAAYPPAAFVALIRRNHIAFHEKKLGQLFCDGSASEIIALLRAECDAGRVAWRMPCAVTSIARSAGGFRVDTSAGPVETAALVIATGGLTVPKIGATPFGYRVAAQFGLPVVPPRPALVPLALPPEVLARFGELSGVAVDAEVTCGDGRFRENVLFTHRGLSGPAILQASSYWDGRLPLSIDLLPGVDVARWLTPLRGGGRQVDSLLAERLPKRLAKAWCAAEGGSGPLAAFDDARLAALARRLANWHVQPAGTLGYAKAEVTLGGVDTRSLHPATLAAREMPGLHFIGEVVDVTGWLGGYNFQWAWASGHAAGSAV